MTYFILMFILQFALSLCPVVVLSIEAHEYGHLTSGEKKWMKAGLLGLATSPLGGVIIPLSIPVGFIALIVYAVRQLKE